MLKEVTVQVTSIRNYMSIRRARTLGDVWKLSRLFFSGFPLKMCTTSQSQYQSIGAQGLEGWERDLDSAVPNCFPERNPPEVGWNMIMFLCSGTTTQYIVIRGKVEAYELLWLRYEVIRLHRQRKWSASFAWRRQCTSTRYNNVNTEIHTQSTWRTIMEMRYYYTMFLLSFPIKETTSWG